MFFLLSTAVKPTLVQTYHLEMQPDNRSVMERLAPSAAFTTFSITTPGDHGLYWSGSGSNQLSVSLSSSAHTRKSNQSFYLERKGSFTVKIRAVTSGSQPLSSVAFNIYRTPYASTSVLVTGGAISGHGRGKTTSVSALIDYVAESYGSPNPVDVTGTIENVGTVFQPTEWSWNGSNWVTSYKYIVEPYGSTLINLSEALAEATSGTGGGTSTSDASGYYTFDAPDVNQ